MIKSFILAASVFLSASFIVHPVLTAEQIDILRHLSIVQLDDGQGGTVKTLRISDLNVQIVNGLNSTETINGLGNLIIGYNELQISNNNRTGSHNLIAGSNNDYTNYASIVAGLNNVALSNYSAILSGTENTVNANGSCVVGGSENIVSPKPNNGFPASIIVGGQWNNTTSDHCVIIGGGFNIIDGLSPGINSGRWSVIVGGGGVTATNGNLMQGAMSVIVGGGKQLITDVVSSSIIVGGRENVITGTGCVISGGFQRNLSGLNDWAAGSLYEDD